MLCCAANSNFRFALFHLKACLLGPSGLPTIMLVPQSLGAGLVGVLLPFLCLCATGADNVKEYYHAWFSAVRCTHQCSWQLPLFLKDSGCSKKLSAKFETIAADKAIFLLV